jgi:hypothetical protein
MDNKIKMRVEVSGHYKLEIRKANGDVRQTLEFDNLITDIGLNRMGDFNDWFKYCQVGSGSTAPTVGDTALVSWVASSNTVYGVVVQSAQPSPPYYCATIKTLRFAAGTATGNLSEVGMGWTSASGNLFSRALILDGLGDPTTITVLSDETLDVTYEIRQYMPTVDASDTIILRSITHDYIGRAEKVTDNVYWAQGTEGRSAGVQAIVIRHAYDGAIGTITTSPGGNPLIGAWSVDSYSEYSLERTHTIFFSTSAGNFATGITAIALNMGIGSYQFGFTPAIMKTDVDELSLTFKISWARKTL